MEIFGQHFIPTSGHTGVLCLSQAHLSGFDVKLPKGVVITLQFLEDIYSLLH